MVSLHKLDYLCGQDYRFAYTNTSISTP